MFRYLLRCLLAITEKRFVEKAGCCLLLWGFLTGCASGVEQKWSQIQETAMKETPLFGPQNGLLVHDITDEVIPFFSTEINQSDFIVDAKFTNPQDASAGPWDYGFIFRLVSGTSHYRLIIFSDRRWQLKVYDATSGRLVAEGPLELLDTREGAQNHLRLICRGAQGAFYLNDRFVSEMDLSSSEASGNVWAATAMWQGDEIAGKTTIFEGLTVWRIKKP